VNNGETAGPQTATITYDTSNDTISTPAFAVISYTRTAGFTADDTAGASFQSAFPSPFDLNRYFTPGTTCSDEESGLGKIVLVADFTPYDALSANYLASWAGTGVVITPFGSLSTAAANIIRNYGIGTVYIVGGTAAVSQAVQNQLQGMQAYCEGGTTPDNGSTGAPVNLSVVRVAGTTAAETSSLVSQFPGANNVGDECATPGAYPNTFNDTTGKSSASGPAATGCFTTAIVATDFTFQDSLGGGPLSYTDSLPTILTDQSGLSNSAADALVNLGIQQVYLLGGPGAVSDAVVTSIQNLGISVLRIAGLTYGDTSVELARFELANQTSGNTPVTEGLDIGTPSAIGSSRGDFYTDALTSAAALSDEADGIDCDCDFNPLVLTQDTSTVGSSVDQFLKDAGNTATTPLGSNVWALQVFGGTLAQTPALVQQELNDIATG
jgi:putative cell wall-binding protein